MRHLFSILKEEQAYFKQELITRDP